MTTRIWPYIAFPVALVLGKVMFTPEWQEAVGVAAKSAVVAVVGPLLALVNSPAFVYVTSVTILCAALAVSEIYYLRVVRPKVRQLRQLRADIAALPPHDAQGGDGKPWHAALGDVLRGQRLFLTAWAVLRTESAQLRRIPDKPFAYYAAADPAILDLGRSGLMQAMPGYFTWGGLILTFFGLVVALYFAARGFRSGNMEEARFSILALLNASSFKFLTSVAALAGAFLISVTWRLGLSQLRSETEQATAAIESHISLWRDRQEPATDEERDLTVLVARLGSLVEVLSGLSIRIGQLVDEVTPPHGARHAAE